MKFYKWIVLFLLLAIVFVACKEVLEEQITGKTVELISPAENAVSLSTRQTFRWTEVEGALLYRLQIASPGFDSIGSLVLDTTFSKTQVSYTLFPGQYQWRVMAKNGSSETLYSTRSLRIDSADLEEQKVLLTSPVTDSITNQQEITFRWDPVPGATSYRIQLDTVNFDGTALSVDNTVLTNAYLFTFTSNGVYQWRVQALNDTRESQWSDINTISFDTTPPQVVSLLSPADNKTVTKPVTLSWTGSLTATKYKVYAFLGDSSTLFNSSFPLMTTSTAYDFNMGELNQRIYWKVSAVDKAGNESDFSAIRSFIIGQ